MAIRSMSELHLILTELKEDYGVNICNFEELAHAASLYGYDDLASFLATPDIRLDWASWVGSFMNESEEVLA